jgi:hypothetical protein
VDETAVPTEDESADDEPADGEPESADAMADLARAEVK